MFVMLQSEPVPTLVWRMVGWFETVFLGVPALDVSAPNWSLISHSLTKFSRSSLSKAPCRFLPSFLVLFWVFNWFAWRHWVKVWSTNWLSLSFEIPNWWSWSMSWSTRCEGDRAYCKRSFFCLTNREAALASCSVPTGNRTSYQWFEPVINRTTRKSGYMHKTSRTIRQSMALVVGLNYSAI